MLGHLKCNLAPALHSPSIGILGVPIARCPVTPAAALRRPIATAQRCLATFVPLTSALQLGIRRDEATGISIT